MDLNKPVWGKGRWVGGSTFCKHGYVTDDEDNMNVWVSYPKGALLAFLGRTDHDGPETQHTLWVQENKPVVHLCGRSRWQSSHMERLDGEALSE